MQEKRNLYIIGASNFARELESWLHLINEKDRTWKLVGFLHSYTDESPLRDYPTDYSIVGDWQTFEFTSTDLCLIGVADVKWKEKIYNFLKDKVQFFTYIAPNAIVGKFNEIGEGSIIAPNVLLSTNIKLGKCVTLNFGTQIGHDTEIGDFTSVMPMNSIAGNVKIGAHVYSGAGAIYLPKISIVENTTVGAGSVVVTSITKENTTVFGNPARKISMAINE